MILRQGILTVIVYPKVYVSSFPRATSSDIRNKMDKLDRQLHVDMPIIFCKQKNMQLILNDNLEKEHRSMKKVRRGTVFLPKICRIFLKKVRILTQQGFHKEMDNISNVSPSVPFVNYVSNINKVTFETLNVSSIRNKFDFIDKDIPMS